jgi:hypothetical protein
LASKKYKPSRKFSQGFFPLAYPFYIFGQLFSVLASKNIGLLASLASVLKTLSTLLPEKTDIQHFIFTLPLLAIYIG